MEPKPRHSTKRSGRRGDATDGGDARDATRTRRRGRRSADIRASKRGEARRAAHVRSIRRLDASRSARRCSVTGVSLLFLRDDEYSTRHLPRQNSWPCREETVGPTKAGTGVRSRTPLARPTKMRTFHRATLVALFALLVVAPLADAARFPTRGFTLGPRESTMATASTDEASEIGSSLAETLEDMLAEVDEEVRLPLVSRADSMGRPTRALARSTPPPRRPPTSRPDNFALRSRRYSPPPLRRSCSRSSPSSTRSSPSTRRRCTTRRTPRSTSSASASSRVTWCSPPSARPRTAAPPSTA